MNRYFAKEYINGQKAQKKMTNVLSHQGNVTQNHTAILLHTCQDSYNKKEGKQQMIAM